jgi:hypothetical protein
MGESIREENRPCLWPSFNSGVLGRTGAFGLFQSLSLSRMRSASSLQTVKMCEKNALARGKRIYSLC